MLNDTCWRNFLCNLPLNLLLMSHCAAHWLLLNQIKKRKTTIFSLLCGLLYVCDLVTPDQPALKRTERRKSEQQEKKEITASHSPFPPQYEAPSEWTFTGIHVHSEGNSSCKLLSLVFLSSLGKISL